MRPRARFWAPSDDLAIQAERNGQVVVDTVLNEMMQPVFSKQPSEVHRRLQHPYSETWAKVLIGESQKIVTIPEYLYREKYDMVIATLNEVMSKKDLSLYKRDPARLQEYIERTAQKLIERILDK